MKITRQMVEDAAAHVGGDFRDDYSGRGMYGDLCCGVVCESYEREALVNSIAESLCADEMGSDYEDGDLEDYAEDVGAQMSADNMGLRAIYYFPRVKP
jgi:hypothetical protein